MRGSVKTWKGNEQMTEQTWEISDIDGTNKRTVTLAQYRAEVEAAKVRALAIYNANKPVTHYVDGTGHRAAMHPMAKATQ